MDWGGGDAGVPTDDVLAADFSLADAAGMGSH